MTTHKHVLNFLQLTKAHRQTPLRPKLTVQYVMQFNSTILLQIKLNTHKWIMMSLHHVSSRHRQYSTVFFLNSALHIGKILKTLRIFLSGTHAISKYQFKSDDVDIVMMMRSFGLKIKLTSLQAAIWLIYSPSVKMMFCPSECWPERAATWQWIYSIFCLLE